MSKIHADTDILGFWVTAGAITKSSTSNTC